MLEIQTKKKLLRFSIKFVTTFKTLHKLYAQGATYLAKAIYCFHYDETNGPKYVENIKRVVAERIEKRMST